MNKSSFFIRTARNAGGVPFGSQGVNEPGIVQTKHRDVIDCHPFGHETRPPSFTCEKGRKKARKDART